MEEVDISIKYNVRQSLIELYGKEEVDENWEMVEDAMEHMQIFSNKLPIHNVSKAKRTACRCGRPYSEKDLQDGMCNKCYAPTTEY